jgi:uncharacterized protein (DUF1501 family)
VHATATPYRERSHFGQDVLESGIARPGAVLTLASEYHERDKN